MLIPAPARRRKPPCPCVYIVITDAIVKLGPVAGKRFSCQVTSASIIGTPNLSDVPQTFCDPPTQAVGESSYTLDLEYLQDWGATDSLSRYLWDNEGDKVEFEVSASASAPAPSGRGDRHVPGGGRPVRRGRRHRPLDPHHVNAVRHETGPRPGTVMAASADASRTTEAAA